MRPDDCYFNSQTPLYEHRKGHYGQFGLPLRKESPYIFSKLNLFNTDAFYRPPQCPF